MSRFASILFASLILLDASSAFSQTTDRAWIDVNVVSVTSAQDEQTFTYDSTLFAEPFRMTASYPKMPRATGALLGGGVGLTKGLGVAVQFVNAKYEYTAGLSITVPHPLFFNRSATDATVTNETLERKENAIDISAVYQVPTPDAWRVRVFGGPTYFKLKQELVEDIEYTQIFGIITPTNVVDITRFTQEEIDESVWGFHVGGDVSYFFSRHVGVGGTARFNRGTVSLEEEPFSLEPGELKVGGAIIGGGLRLRF
jgi:hypothetical protein